VNFLKLIVLYSKEQRGGGCMIKIIRFEEESYAEIETKMGLFWALNALDIISIKSSWQGGESYPLKNVGGFMYE